MNVGRWLVLGSLSVSLLACGDKKKEETEEEEVTPKKTSTAASQPTEAPKPPTAAPVTTETAPKPAGIEARVKAELDKRADGITGSALSIAGAAASIQTPKEWVTTQGPVAVVKSKDEKARIGATSFTGDPTTRVEAAAGAAGLSNCQWGAPETLTLGKDNLPGTASDGVCSRGAGQVKAAFMAVNGLVTVGSWDADGDMASVFGSMRSVVKAVGGTDSIAACCAALRSNAKSAPPQQMGLYMMAAGTCDGLKSNPQARQMLGQVRAALAGAAVPASCR